MILEKKIENQVASYLKSICGEGDYNELVHLQKTRAGFKGDITLVVFPLLKLLKQKPAEAAQGIGEYLSDNMQEVMSFNVIKGFLNIEIDPGWWTGYMNMILQEDSLLKKPDNKDSSPVLVEFSSPNTNKPLHLGHIRNNLLGMSISRIIEASGKPVKKVNLVNDRGIHICKTMLAWQKWGDGTTPEKADIKGDHFVGEYYVMFEKELRKEIDKLRSESYTEEEALQKAPLMKEAREMLRKWESGDRETLDLWKTMNRWVYEGFDETYKELGVSFHKVYYESGTYKVGREVVEEGLKRGVLEKKEDGSVWADLGKYSLDKKLLLRSDGTSVYMTQDIGTAVLRYNDFSPAEMLYVVGNEQDYHFKVLQIVLRELGYEWAEKVKHISYGMVELPGGRMKSREGTVVDADDIISEMEITAQRLSEELGKLDEVPPGKRSEVVKMIGMGALKYFILKVDPRKNMLFNPEESIDFNGNTGPFIQYTHARVCSLRRKCSEAGITEQESSPIVDMSSKELMLLKLLYDFQGVVSQAAEDHSPALIANYVYELAKEYNQFYHDHPILRESRRDVQQFRLLLSVCTGRVIKSAMYLLGAEVPERM